MMKFRDFSSDLTIRTKDGRPSAPRVSVILPTYSRADGPLQQSIESVLSQSYGDFELIIVDDGSRDGTADVLNHYLLSDSRVTIHSYSNNSGLPALRVDQAALRARGEYVAYQFDDDLWTADSLKTRIGEIEKLGHQAVVYGTANAEMYHDDGSASEVSFGRPFNYGLLANGNYIANCTVIHHKSLFYVAGMYDPHVCLRRFSDYDLWLRFARHADFIWIDCEVARVRANLEKSLGKTVPLLYTLYRKCIGTQRNALLMPSYIENYDVLDPAPFERALTKEELDLYIRRVAMPFLVKHNDYCSDAQLQMAAAMRSAPIHVLVTKPDYSTSVHVTIENFSRLPQQRAVLSTFVREADLPAVDVDSFDAVILYRTVSDCGSRLVEQQDRTIPVAYLMDDNMLHFFEVGPEHRSLAPGTILHQRIVDQIRGADACIGYSDPIVEDFQSLNPRTIRLHTNIPSSYVEARRYERGARLSVAVLTGSGRVGILRQLWPALSEFAKRHSDEVEFHFWGIDPSDLGQLSCPVIVKPFTHSYERYLTELAGTAFDVALVPLDDSTRAARSKSPVKLPEGLVAGAFCVFSDAPPYSDLPDDCCIKVPNTTEAWLGALERVFALGTEGRASILENARSLVLSRYTTESQFSDFLAAFDALKLHAFLKGKAIVYGFHEPALGGATLHLMRHAALVKSLGFRVIGLVPGHPIHGAVFATRWREMLGDADLIFDDWRGGYSGSQTDSGASAQRTADRVDSDTALRLAACLVARKVGLLHFSTWSPTMSLLGRALGVPVVASVHQFYAGADGSIEGFADAVHCSSLTYALAWERASKVKARWVVCPVDERYFGHFRSNRERIGKDERPVRILVSGTVQPRKNQVEAILTLGELVRRGVDATIDILGYTEFFPDYVEQCYGAAKMVGVSDRVFFHGFVDDPLGFYDRADVLLVSAIDESMPQTVLQAMAAGIPVISVKVGGVTEVLEHRYSGFISETATREGMSRAVLEYLALPPAHRIEMVDRAHRIMALLARPSYVRSELLNIYWCAVESRRLSSNKSAPAADHQSVVRSEGARRRLDSDTTREQKLVESLLSVQAVLNDELET